MVRRCLWAVISQTCKQPNIPFVPSHFLSSLLGGVNIRHLFLYQQRGSRLAGCLTSSATCLSGAMNCVQKGRQKSGFYLEYLALKLSYYLLSHMSLSCNKNITLLNLALPKMVNSDFFSFCHCYCFGQITLNLKFKLKRLSLETRRWDCRPFVGLLQTFSVDASCFKQLCDVL